MVNWLREWRSGFVRTSESVRTRSSREPAWNKSPVRPCSTSSAMPATLLPTTSRRPEAVVGDSFNGIHPGDRIAVPR